MLSASSTIFYDSDAKSSNGGDVVHLQQRMYIGKAANHLSVEVIYDSFSVTDADHAEPGLAYWFDIT